MKHRRPDKIKILVVDDDEKILFAFRQVFTREGYVCIVAKNGPEALEMMQLEKPQIIFMDIAMPGLDGLETLQRMKLQSATVPVIMVTGHGTMQTAIKAIQLGAFDYLTKPLDITKVRDIVRRVLSSVSLQETTHLTFKADRTQTDMS